MVRARVETLTRAKVLQLGLVLLLSGGLGYGFFKIVGLDDANAGIASEAALVLVVIGWTVSYVIRVFTGKMTFMEQRKRYRIAYEELTSTELKERFEALSEEEKSHLIKELESEGISTNTSEPTKTG